MIQGLQDTRCMRMQCIEGYMMHQDTGCIREQGFQNTRCIRIQGILGYWVYHDTRGLQGYRYRVYQDMNLKKITFISRYKTIQYKYNTLNIFE